MELTVLQLAIIGLVVTALAAGIKIVVAKFSGVVLSRGWISIVAYIASALLAFVFLFAKLPELSGGDIADNVTAIMTFVTALFGAATLIYNLLLARLLEKLGLSTEKLLAKFSKEAEPIGGNQFRG